MAQKRLIRLMCRKGPRTSCRPLFQKLKIMTVYSLFVYETVVYMRERVGGEFLSNCQIHGHNTRGKSKIHVGVKRGRGSNELHLAVRLYNHIPKSLTDLPMKKFKKTVGQRLTELPLYNIKGFFEMKL